MQAYADSVETVAREEIRTIAEECLGKMNEAGGKVEMGTMMRTVVKALEEGGKGFVKADVAGVVKEVMGGKS